MVIEKSNEEYVCRGLFLRVFSNKMGIVMVMHMSTE